MEERTNLRHRYYKYSINIGPLRVYNNSKIYDIEDGKSTLLPGLLYSITTILLGWWSFSLLRPFEHIKNSFEALHINFSGGEDITKLISDENFDDITNYVWNNLLKTTKDKTNKFEIEKILELYYEYLERNDKSLSSCEFISLGLSRFKIYNLKKIDIEDVIDAINSYSNQLLEDNF